MNHIFDDQSTNQYIQVILSRDFSLSLHRTSHPSTLNSDQNVHVSVFFVLWLSKKHCTVDTYLNY